ncbi:MAG: alpha/beta hydrolase family protein [Deferribacterales bacterium]
MRLLRYSAGGGAVFFIPALSFLFFFLSLTAAAFNSGIRYFSLPYHGHDFEYSLWYPTKQAETKHEFGLYEISAAKDAPVSTDVKGVVVLAHGFGGNMYGQHDTAEYLARNGYAVVTLTYPDMWGLKQREAVFHPVHLRPKLSVLALDNLRKSGTVNPKAFRNIYVAGFSMGGYTAAVLAGGKVDLGLLKSFCGRPDAPILLCLPGNKQKLAKLKNADINLTLPNLRAAVLMAPAYGVLSGKDSFKDVKITVSVYAAEFDSVVTGDKNALYVASIIPDKTLTVIKNADHMVFISPCAESKLEKFYDLCEDDESVDRAGVHVKMNKDILHLFDNSLQ